MDRRSSVIEPTGGYGPDTRSQFNTTTTLPKPQQRAPEIGQRQPRPELYQQYQPQSQQQQTSPFSTSNRPLVQQHQQQYRPQPPQQQQQSRTPGDKVSPWNLIRQTLPPDSRFRGPPPPSQQRQPPPPQYYSMQQQQRPPQPQEQQQYRPPPMLQERRPTLSRIEDRPAPYRENVGKPNRQTGGGGDDDEEVVVNSSVTNQQPPPPPPLSRRDSTVYAGVRPSEAGDQNRQWQRQSITGAVAYGKPQEQQQYVSRQPTVILENQDQRYPPQASNYSRPQQQQQDDDNTNRRSVVPNSQKPRDVQQPLTRRDSVLDATFRVQTDAGSRRNDAAQLEYGRRPPMPDSLQEDGGRRPPPEMGGTGRKPLPLDPQEDGVRRQPHADYYKKPEPEDVSGRRRLSDFRNSRPGVEMAEYGGVKPANKEDRSSVREFEQKQQQALYYDRKVSLDKERDRGKAELDKDILSAKAGDEQPQQAENRTSESRKTNFEIMRGAQPANEQQQQQQQQQQRIRETENYSRMTVAMDGEGRTMGRPARHSEDVVASRPRDYAAAVQARSSISENEPPNKIAAADKVYRSDKDGTSLTTHSKNTRPDTLKIIKDSEPLKDSSNSKGNHKSDDVEKSPSKIPKKERSDLLKTPTRAGTPKSPDGTAFNGQKKLPMNKVQVGSAPSPNLKVVRSKVGSLQNTSHKPGGGQVKIESRKLEWKAGTRVVAKNDAYVPGGGDKKIQSTKLQWNAKPKVGSLENKTHKPGGGDKKIETVKLDFKDKAKPKIGSKDNIKHTPGGGAIKIEDQKLEIKAQSKVGSLDNVKHRPGGGEVKIFDDKNYIKQTAGTPTKSQLWKSSSMKSPTCEKLHSTDKRPKSQVKIIVTPSEEDLHNNTQIDTNKGRPRRSASVRSPSPLQHNIIIPEEEVRSN